MRRWIIASCCALLAGCATTRPALDQKHWVAFATEYPGGVVRWRAPDLGGRNIFRQYINRVDDEPGNAAMTTRMWWQGYDVNSWGFTAFTLMLDLNKYPKRFDVPPTMKMLREELLSRWPIPKSDYTLDQVSIGSREWVHFTFNDEIGLRREIFRTVVDRKRYMSVIVEYDKEALKNSRWLQSRQAVVSNVLATITIEQREQP